MPKTLKTCIEEAEIKFGVKLDDAEKSKLDADYERFDKEGYLQKYEPSQVGAFVVENHLAELTSDLKSVNDQIRSQMREPDQGMGEGEDVAPGAEVGAVEGKEGQTKGAEEIDATQSSYPMESRDKWYGDADYEARGGNLVEVSPDEYLALAKDLPIDDEVRENVDDLKQHIIDGNKLDPLALYGTDKTKVRDSDGRHRAIAAKELGIEKVPVLDFTDTLKPKSSDVGKGKAAGGIKDSEMIDGVTFPQFENMVEKGSSEDIKAELNQMKSEGVDIVDRVSPEKMKSRIWMNLRDKGVEKAEAKTQANQIVEDNYAGLYDEFTGGKEEGFDPLKTLMEGASKESIAAKEEKVQKQKVDTDIVDTHIQKLKDDIEDWSSRVYKQNKKTVAIGGDKDNLNAPLTSIGAANERRRKKKIDWMSRGIRALEGAKDRIVKGDSLTDIANELEDDGFAFDLTKSPDVGKKAATTTKGITEKERTDRLQNELRYGKTPEKKETTETIKESPEEIIEEEKPKAIGRAYLNGRWKTIVGDRVLTRGKDKGKHEVIILGPTGKKLKRVSTRVEIEGDVQYATSEQLKTNASEFSQPKETPLKKAVAAIKNNPKFKKWFGKSKVTNEKGEPLIAVHMTPEKFSVFDLKKERHVGHHFAISEKGALSEMHSTRGELNVVEAYLKIEKPFVMPDLGLWKPSWLGAWLGEAENKNVYQISSTKEEKAALDELGTAFGWPLNSWKPATREQEKQRGEYYDLVAKLKRTRNYDKANLLFQSILKRAGFDGVQYYNETAYEQAYIAFDSNQIKSIYNQGTFDPKNPDIRYSTTPSKADSASTKQKLENAFKGSIVTEQGDAINVSLPNGMQIKVDPDASITIDPTKMEAAYGRIPKEGEKAVGAFQRIGKDGLMWLAKEADQGVVHHEAFHGAWDLLTRREQKVTLKKHGSIENSAIAYGNWTPSTPNTVFQKIMEFFKKLMNAVVPSAEGTFAKVREGDVWERPQRDGAISAKMAGSAQTRQGKTGVYQDIGIPVKKNGKYPSVYDIGASEKEIGDSMLPIGNMWYSVNSLGQKDVEFQFDYSSPEAKKVNGRLARELREVRRLFGPTAMQSMAVQRPIKTEKGVTEYADVVAPHDAFLWLQGKTADKRIMRLLDKNVPIRTLAQESGVTVFRGKATTKTQKESKKEYGYFVTGVKKLRYAFDNIDKNPTGKNDLIILGDNSKAGAHVAFALFTCHPTSGCKVCYAAGDMYQGVIARGVRMSILVLKRPKAFGKRLAEEVMTAHPDKSELPFFRLLGAGDVTHKAQVIAFNELAKHLDRPIHIFSRHHDFLGKLKSTRNAPFIRMASVDAQLFKHYGLTKLKNNKDKRGILTAYLLSSERDIPEVKKLYDRHALALVLPANGTLYQKMVAKHPELEGTACPCDAKERPHNFSCQLCAGSRAGCFMFANELFVDGRGNTWVHGDPKMPKKVSPLLQFGSGPKIWIGAQKKIIQTSIDATMKKLTKYYGPVKLAYEGKHGENSWRKLDGNEKLAKAEEFKEKNPNTQFKPIKLYDLRWTGDVGETTDPAVASSYIEAQKKVIDETTQGNVRIPETNQGPAIALEGGKPVPDAGNVTGKQAPRFAKSEKPTTPLTKAKAERWIDKLLTKAGRKNIGVDVVETEAELGLTGGEKLAKTPLNKEIVIGSKAANTIREEFGEFVNEDIDYELSELADGVEDDFYFIHEALEGKGIMKTVDEYLEDEAVAYEDGEFGEDFNLEEEYEPYKQQGKPVPSEYEKRARSEFGITSNPGTAGFILANGDMLDFSGGPSGGTRGLDHRAIERVVRDKKDPDAYRYGAIQEFGAKTGAIRWNYTKNDINIDLLSKPTQEQLSIITDLIKDQNVFIDYIDSYGKERGVDAKGQEAKELLNRVAKEASTTRVLYAKDGQTTIGAFDPKTGRITLVAENLSEETVWPTLLHEAVHQAKETGGWQGVFGKRYDPLMKSIDRQIKEGNKAWVEAQQKAKDAGVSDDLIKEETITYFLSNNANKNQNLWQRIVNTIRAWAVNAGIKHDISTKDIVALAENMTQRRARTSAENFEDWFKGSKVVDEKGEPLVVYHGTKDAFTEFDPSRAGQANYVSDEADRVGLHFTTNKDDARAYGGSSINTKVMPVYLSAKNIAEGGPVFPMSPKEARDAGYDGMSRNTISGGKEFVVFQPTQIKSVFNQGTWDPANPDIRKATRSMAEPFFSQLIKVVTDNVKTMPTKVQSITNWLQKKQQVKPAEMKWMGVDQWMKDNQTNGKIDRESFLEFLKSNDIEVREVVKGGEDKDLAKDLAKIDNELEAEISELSDFGFSSNVLEKLSDAEIEKYKGLTEEDKSRVQEISAKIGILEGNRTRLERHIEVVGDTKHSDPAYQLPGGTGYKEMVFVLPEQTKGTGEYYVIWAYGGVGDLTFKSEAKAKAYLDKMKSEMGPGEVDQIHEPVAPYQSAHYDEANVLAHVRWNERTDADGKRVLFVEEVQSDWLQEAKEKGFKGEELPEGFKFKQLSSTRMVVIGPSGKVLGSGTTKKEAIASARQGNSQGLTLPPGVPKAPFLENWHEYVMKRMLRMAAEQGFDKVALAPAKVHFDRWGSDRYAWERQPDGTWLVEGTEQKGGQFEGGDIEERAREQGILKEMNATSVKTKQDLMGIIAGVSRDIDKIKPLTDKIWTKMQTGTKGVHMPRWEGMKSFYDERIPGFLRAYGKQWGAEVGSTEIGTSKHGESYEIEKEIGKHQDGEMRWILYESTESGATEYDSFPTKEEAEAQKTVLENISTESVHSINITPEMRESVIFKGQTKFMMGDKKESPRKQFPWEVGLEKIIKKDVVAIPTSAELIEDMEKDRTFANKIHEQKDLFIAQVNEMVRRLENQVKELTGTGKKKGPIGRGLSSVKTKYDERAARDLSAAMLYYRESQINPEKGAEFEAYAENELKTAKGEKKLRLKKQLKIYRQSQSLTKEQQDFVNTTMDAEFGKIGDIAQKAGIIQNTVENYVRRIIKFPTEQAKESWSGSAKYGFKTFTTASMHRKVDTIFDHFMLDRDLKISGVVNSFGEIGREVGIINANKNFIKAAMATGVFTTNARKTGYAPLNAQGFSAWARKAGVKLKTDPDFPGLIQVDSLGRSIFFAPPIVKFGVTEVGKDRVKKYFESKKEAEEFVTELKGKDKSKKYSISQLQQADLFEKVTLHAPQRIADMLNRMTGTGSGIFEAPVMKGLLRFNAGIKGWVLLSSFFHHMAGQRSWSFGVDHHIASALKERKFGQAIKNIGEMVNSVSAHKRGLEKFKAMTPEISLLLKHGLTVGEMQDWSEGLLREQGGLTETVARKLGAEKLTNLIERGKIKREMFTNSLFKRYFAGLKVEAAVIELNSRIKKAQKKGETPNVDLLAEQVAKLINADFGGLHLGRMGRSKDMQKMLRLLLLAPDWTESNFRTFTGMFPFGVNNKINKLIGDMPSVPGMKNVYRGFWGGVIIKATIATVLAQALADLWNDDDEDWRSDEFFNNFKRLKWTGVNVTGLYRSLGIDIEQNERKIFSIVGHFADPLKVIHPEKLIKGKGSPLTRIGESVMTKSDWRERPYTSFGEWMNTGRLKKKSRFEPKENFFSALPSIATDQVISMQPIQVGYLLRYLQGEEDGLSAALSSAGAHVTSAYKPTGGYDPGNIEDFNANRKEVNYADKEFKRLLGKDRQKAIDFNKDTNFIKRFKKGFSEASRQLSKLRKRKEEIMESKQIPNSRKKTLITNLNKRMAQIAEAHNVRFKRYKNQV